MKLVPEKLSVHLKSELLPTYAVAGEEPLLIEESLDAIRSKARAEGFEEREVFHVERGFDWGRVIETCGSLSLFATKKIVELRMPKGPNPVRGKAGDASSEAGDEAANSGAGNKRIDGAKIIAELLENPPQDILLIAAGEKLESRQQKSGWFSLFEQAGAAVYCDEIPEERWPRWVEARLKAHGLKPDQDAIEFIAEMTRGNALAAVQDIEKLSLLLGKGATVSGDSVREAIADSARFDAGDLADAVLLGDLSGAARKLARLREEGLDVLAVLGPFTWVLRQWSMAQVQFARSGDANRACNDARVFPRARFGLYARALPRTRPVQTFAWLRQASVIDQLAKSTGGRDRAWEELLTLVLAAAGRRVVRPQGL